MSKEGLGEIIIEDPRGLHDFSESVLEVEPPYASDCSDVDFLPGRVFSRAGLNLLATAEVVSMAEFALLDTTTRRLMILENDGQLRKDYAALTLIASDLIQASDQANLRMKSVTAFGRHYMAFSDRGLTAKTDPLQYDDTNLDRVAPSGPGGAPVIATGAAGTISAGVHKFRVFFRTRNGYWTALSPSVSYTAPGSAKVNLTEVPIGPAWVVERVIAATPEFSDDYYLIEGTNMVLGDNTTTSITGIDFTDSELINGTAVSSLLDEEEDLLQQIELPPQVGVNFYSGRLVWWGERNNLIRNFDEGFVNLSFDGGFNAAGAIPRGWTQVAAGGSKVTDANEVGDVLRITGDGTNQRGRFQNTGVASKVIPAGIAIRARVKIKRTAGAAAGSFHVFWTGTGAPAADLQINAADVSSTEWRLIDGLVLAAADNKPAADWRLNITSGGTGYGGTAITNAQSFDIGRIEIYPTPDPDRPSLLRWSKALDPEAYSGLTGFQNIAENDGQRIRTTFVLRNNFYIVKDRAFYVTHDTGEEPAFWPWDEISNTVGTPSLFGVATADGWALIAGKAGLYFFGGGRLDNIALEIRKTWNRINWNYGHAIWVAIDEIDKRIQVGVPLDAATAVSHILNCRYVGASPLERRDWSPWVVAARCQTFYEESGTRLWLYGATHSAQGRIAKLDKTTTSDFLEVQIAPYYITAALPRNVAGINLFGKLKTHVTGVGNMTPKLWFPDGSSETLNLFPLAANQKFEVERGVGTSADRIRVEYRVATGLANYFSLQRIVLGYKPDPNWQERGQQ